MAQPFFSIIIPTRGRPALLRDALISALKQDFDDFEVVVSDNFNDDQTQTVLDEFAGNECLRCVRTGRLLSMPEHWEFASNHVRGRYVLFLTDRSALRQGALATIYRAIVASDLDVVDVCAWRWSILNDEFGNLVSTDQVENTNGIILNSVDVATRFVKQEYLPYQLPRALNSCFSAEMAARIRAQHGKLFFPISPDFTSAFLLLAYSDKLLYIDAPLFMSRGLGVSNGGNAYKGDGTDYMKSLGITEWYRYVPIKGMLVESLLYEDFLAIKEMAGGNLLKVEMDWVEYFVRCNKEIQFKRAANILNQQQIGILQGEWNRALKNMNRDTRHKVKEYIQEAWPLKMKAIIRKLPFFGSVRRLRDFIRSLRQA